MESFIQYSTFEELSAATELWLKAAQDLPRDELAAHYGQAIVLSGGEPAARRGKVLVKTFRKEYSSAHDAIT